MSRIDCLICDHEDTPTVYLGRGSGTGILNGNATGYGRGFKNKASYTMYISIFSGQKYGFGNGIYCSDSGSVFARGYGKGYGEDYFYDRYCEVDEYEQDRLLTL